MLEVEEYLLKERFDAKYLHQVPYLRDAYGVGVLQHVFGVCSSCCYLSGTCRVARCMEGTQGSLLAWRAASLLLGRLLLLY